MSDDFARSSFCNLSACVEVSVTSDGRFAVRQSSRTDHVLYFTADEWHAFLLGVKAGEFDLY